METNELTNQGFKIVGLQADGLKKLRAIEMKFADKGLIPIKGKNKQGKTTILESIAVLIEGKKHLEKDSINWDSEVAHIVGELAEGDKKFRIERYYRRDKEPILRVTGPDGKKVEGRVQDFLDTFTNLLTLNPFPFINKTPEEKLRFLMKLFKIDFTDLNAQIKTLEDDRLYAGRKVKEFGEIEPVEAVKKVDISDIIEKKRAINTRNEEKRLAHEQKKSKMKGEINAFNALQSIKKQRINRFEGLRDKLVERKETLKNGLDLSDSEEIDQAEIREITILIEAIEKTIKNMPQPEMEKQFDMFAVPEPEYEKTETLDSQIEQAGSTNEKAAQYERFLERKAEKEKWVKKYQEYDSQIEALRDEKKKILRETDTKVKGLEIREDGVYHDGTYSENWSDSEAMIISLQLCEAMMPRLRAIFLDRAESLDEDAIESLKKWAIEKDIQLIVTIVDTIPDDKEEGCFYIEEGKLVN